MFWDCNQLQKEKAMFGWLKSGLAPVKLKHLKVRFEFNCDHEIIVCKLFDLGGGPFIRIPRYDPIGIVRLLPNGKAVGQYSGTWEPHNYHE